MIASWEGRTFRQVYPRVDVDETLTLDLEPRESPATQRRRHEREHSQGGMFAYTPTFFHLPDIDVYVTWRSEDRRWHKEDMRVG